MRKKYIVRLIGEERIELNELVKKGHTAARKRLRAEILLKADEGENGPGWTDDRIAEAFNVGPRTVERTRQRLVEEGLETALNGRKRNRSEVIPITLNHDLLQRPIFANTFALSCPHHRQNNSMPRSRHQ